MTGATIKRIVSIAIFLGFAIWAMFANDVVLGLDLQGGVTMRYELQPPESSGPLSDEQVASMIDSTVETLRDRIDAYGIKESNTVRQGTREVVIELPGKGKDEAETIKSVISRVGRLEFRIVASDDVTKGLSVADERARLAALLETHKGKGPDEIDVTSLDRRFPDVLYRWVAYSDKLLAERRKVGSLDELKGEGEAALLMVRAPLVDSDYQLMRLELGASRTFTGADIESAAASTDSRGNPCVSITMRAGRSRDFGDFTEPNKGQLLAIVLDGRIGEDPATINERLEGSFVIQSGAATGFSEKEIRDYLTVIRSGSLQMKPRLLYENTIGPSLGESAISAGINAALVGMAVVVLFMIAYYRWHGVHATLTLVANVVLLSGLLMFLGATVTLPGIAGLVLTFGMAVDANILIYERMREEMAHAKSPAQVVKLGFEKALSTILDSNITTFITGLILFKVGSGPVKGFAVVLMLGLATSVWATLVVGRAMYDVLLETGRMKTIGSMGRFIRPDTNIGFMRIGTACMKVSAVAVVASLLAFATVDRDMFGLDFLGGYKAQVRLGRPATQGEVKAAVDRVFPGAQVISVAGGGEELAAGTSRQFVVKVKSSASRDEAGESTSSSEDRLERYEAPMKQALAGLVLPDFVTEATLEENAEEATTKVSGVLNFEASADPAAIAPNLGLLSQLQTEPAGDTAVRFSGVMAGTGLDRQLVAQRLKLALDGKPGVPRISEPLQESTTIGARVGAELRDSAFRAILVSFAAIVLYMRVRFREYRYGVAAVLALVHDVSIALGVVCVAHRLHLLDVEIDLPMIAAFLTIVGYSINDTIVMFDRVRENLPRMPSRPLTEVLDVSMNQVLSRSILTSLTVFLTLLVIFILNLGKQNVLEGFSFAMLIGVIVGSYSTIYVASPLLLLFSSREDKEAAAGIRAAEGKTA
jgi:SecD/SecF fusion protein